MQPFTVVRHGSTWQCDLGFGDYDRDLFYLGTYETDTIAHLRSIIRPGDTVIDVGANIGYFTVIMAKLVGRSGRVVSFEPSTRFFSRLMTSVSLNDASDRVVAEKLALSDSKQRLRLHVGSTTASVTMRGRQFDLTEEDVAGSTLDDYWAGSNRPVSLIKIDVDGTEVRVLLGAEQLIRRWQPAIVVEICPYVLSEAGSSAETLVRLLEELSYRRFIIVGDPDPVSAAEVLARARQCHPNKFDFFNVIALSSQNDDTSNRPG